LGEKEMKGIRLICAMVAMLVLAGVPINSYADGPILTDGVDVNDESTNTSAASGEDDADQSNEPSDSDDSQDNQPSNPAENQPDDSGTYGVSDGVNGDNAGMGEYEPDPTPSSPTYDSETTKPTKPSTDHQQATDSEQNNTPSTESDNSESNSDQNEPGNSQDNSDQADGGNSNSTVPKAPNSDTSKINSGENKAEGNSWDNFMRILAIVLLAVAIVTITVALVVRGLARRREAKEKNQFDD